MKPSLQRDTPGPGDPTIAEARGAAPPARSSRYAVDSFLVAAIAAAAVLRFWSLGQSLWFDEFVTSNVVYKGNKLMWQLTHNEGSPPLYFYLLYGWTKLFKASD